MTENAAVHAREAGAACKAGARSDAALRADELCAGEELCRAIIENTPDSVKVLDADGRVLMINAPGRRLMEIDDADSLIDRSWLSLWPPEAHGDVESAVARANRGETVRFEAFRPTSRGAPKWWDVIVKPLRDAAGGVSRLLAVSRDVTENKLQQEALRLNRMDLDRAQEVGQIGSWRMDMRRNSLTWSDENYRIFGVPHGAPMTYQSFLEIIHPDDRDYVDKSWTAALKGAPYDIEHRLIVQRRIKWVREKAFLEFDSQGVVIGGFGITQDISERKRAEEALRRSEERFRAVFEHAGTGIAITDWEGRLVQCNPAYCRLLGYSREELAKIVFSDLVHPDDRAANLAEIQRLRIEELPYFEIENRYLRKDGQAVWVHKFVSLLHDESGAPAHLVALVTDVTGRRQMEEALRQADRRKDEFIATLAHELRNPLAPILNALTVMKRRSDSAEMRELHAMIERQVRHLIRLVDELLEISRVSSGKIQLTKQPVDLSTVIAQAIETSGPILNAQRHRVEVSLPAEPLVVEGDVVRLSQIFANLITNAAKYTDPGGRIWLVAERCGAEAVVRVCDSGVGIPSDMLPRVFDLFTQVDRTLGRAQGGLGIGLALVRRLVELHGGRVEAFSAGPGEGSTFIVCLPLTVAAAPREGDGPGADAPAQSSLRVLVIDDNRDAADSLAMLLQMLGARTRVAYSGAAGLAVLHEFAPELVLLDIGMPEMDGFETARRIRAHPAGKQATVVALTGWGQSEDRRRTQEAGFDRHLIKPVAIDALEALLARRPGSDATGV